MMPLLDSARLFFSQVVEKVLKKAPGLCQNTKSKGRYWLMPRTTLIHPCVVNVIFTFFALSRNTELKT